MSRPKYNLVTGKRGGAGAMLLCLVGTAESLRAQSVLMPPPTYSTTPPAVQAAEDAAGAISRDQFNSWFPSFTDTLQWGPITAHPHATYRFLYGNGLQSAPGHSQNSVIQSLTPGVLLNIGSHWTLSYDPTLTFYSNRQFHDTVDHNAIVNWGTFYEDWSFGFAQAVGISDDPSIETAQQTSSQIYTTLINASHPLNSVMSLDLNASQTIVSAANFNSSKSWSTLEWLNYQFFPSLDGGIGAGFGYDKVSLGPDMSHETLQARLTWRVAHKTSVVIHGGAEDRQYLGGGIPDTINPTFGVAVQYQPVATTLMTLSADRGITPSLFSSQITETTTLSIGLNQRLLEHFNLAVSGSYGSSGYLASSSAVVVTRTDSYYSFSARLGCAFLRRASAGLNYQYSMNNSSAAGFAFASTQLGFDLSYGF